MKKLSKKMLALLLSVLMVLTVIPMGAFLATADEPQDNYLFAYFTGNSTEQQRIKFALSEDGKQYYAINKNDPVIKQNLGTGCARDPYVFRGQDGKFYAIATDMNAAGGWWGNSNSFVLWRSNDLITWTDETIIDVSAITGVDVYRAWAPQVTWDATANKYMIYFGLAANGYSAGGTKMHYMYTTDLLDQSKYETPQPMMTNNAVANNDSIDGDITYYNGTYYMFYKDESQGGICIVTSSTINGLYNTDNIVKLEAGSSIGALEGCQVWWDADTSQYVLMADRYSANGVFACYNIGADLDTFYAAVSANNDISGYYNSTMSNSISVLGPRHGSILNITATEYNALKNAYGIASNEDIRYNFNSQDYAAENSWHYDAIQDTSGYSYDVMTNSGQYSYTYTDEHYISLNGSTVFVNDPAVKALLHEAPWTVSFDVSVAETRNAPVFALTSGDSPAASIDWIRLLDNGDAYLYKNGAYTKIGSAPTTLSSVEYTYTIVYNGTSIYFYRDGVLFASDEIGTLGYDNTKATNYAAFGWTDTCGVTGVHGAFTNVRFRSKALTASQVASETAIQSELLYRYNEGTEEINSRINATSTGSDGISTTMSGARGASYAIAAWVNIGSSKDNGVLYQFGAGGTGDNKQYFSLQENGVINYCWNEGSTDHYFDSASIYNFAANTWYYVQVNIVPDGNSAHFRAFVNGVSVMDQTTGYTRMTTHAYNPHAFFMQSSLPVMLGKGNAWWPNSTNSYIDDLRVYTKAIDAAMLYQKQQQEDRAEAAGESGATQGSTLEEAMGIYESRIARMASSGYSVMYTNLSDAYTAYKRAVKAPGTPDEGAALAALNEALLDMQPFVEYTGTNNPNDTDFDVENTGSETYFRNVIYSEPGTDGEHAFTEDVHYEMYDSYGALWKYGAHAYLYYPNTVLLYDGKNTPVVPVVAGFNNKDGRYAVNIIYCVEDMSDFDLKQSRWYGKDVSATLKWPTSNSAIISTDRNNTTVYDEAWTPSGDDNNKYYIYKNGLEYTAVPVSAYTCISSTTWQVMGYYDWAGQSRYNGGIITNAGPDIVVIDYARLTTALANAANSSTNKGYLADLQEKYQAGGLEGIFAAFDSATSLDPNTRSTYFNHNYTYSSDIDAAALLCGKDIDASIKLLNDIKITTDAAEYKDLCDAIEEYETMMASMTGVRNNLSTTYKAYLIALEYKDAYQYGGRREFESPTLPKAAQNLRDEMAKMTLYEIPEADTSTAAAASYDGVIKYKNDATGINSQYYQNIVYWGTEPGTIVKSGNNKVMSNFSCYIPRGNNAAGVNYPTTVLLYDGTNTPKMPVFGAAYKENNGNNRYLFFMYPTTETNKLTKNAFFQMDQVWHGESQHDYQGNDLPPISWNTAWSYSARSNITNATLSNVTYIQGYRYSLFGVYLYSNIAANTMSYKGSGGTTGTGDNTKYYEKFLLPWTCNIGSSYNESSDTAWATSTTPIYVVNYKPIKEKLDDIGENLTTPGCYDVTKYREGGLAEWFQKLENLTALDPNQYEAISHPKGYTYSNDTEAAVIQCGTDIYNAINATTDMPTTPTGTADSKTTGDLYDEDDQLKPIDTDNNAPYTNLKIAILEATAYTEQGCVVNDPWANYQAALAAAKAGMANVANDDSSNPFTKKEGYTAEDNAINTLATNLDAAIQALSDAANTAHPLKFSYREIGTHAMWFQCHNNNSHEIYHHDGEVETVVPSDGTAYDALNIVYRTLDPTKYNDFSTIAAGKVVFDQVKTIPHSTAGMQALGETEKAQRIVNDGITALLTAINESNEGHEGQEAVFPNNYTITFEVYEIDNNGTIDENAKYTDTDDSIVYGTAKPLSVTDWTTWDEDLYEVQYWDVGGHRVNNHDTAITVNSQKDITVQVFIKAKNENAKKVVIKTLGDGDFCTIYVDDPAATTIAIKEGDINTIVINGTDERRVPNSLTYAISGWSVNYGEAITEFVDGTTIADLIGNKDELILKPAKSWKHSSASTTYPFTMDTADVPDGAVPYDYHLRVNANDVDEIDESWTYGGEVYGIVFYNSDHDLFVPVTYDDTYRFYVNRDMDFYTLVYISAQQASAGGLTSGAGYYLPAVNVSAVQGEYKPYKVSNEETLFYLDYKLPMVYSYAEPTGDNGNLENRWTTRSAFTAKVGGSELFGEVTITECGTIYTANESYKTADTLLIENVSSGNSVFQKVNNNRDKDSNQYSYSIKNPTASEQVLYTRAYVKYSYTYQGTKIDAIAYGPVNVCEFSASAQ